MDEVCSEIREDNFLDGLSTNVFDDAEDEEFSDCRRSSHFDFKNVLGEDFTLQISHYVSSSIDLVGLQVWRGAFLLSDYILHHYLEFKSKNSLELAAGTGITSIVSGLFANNVCITDVDRGGILDLIRTNVNNNKLLLNSKNVFVQELDFFHSDSWKNDISFDIILAADVVYDPEITKAFFQTVRNLLTQNPKMTTLIALEKRNRTNEESEVIAPNYDLFMTHLLNLANKYPHLKLESVKLDFPQYFACYERVKELVLWKLHSIQHSC